MSNSGRILFVDDDKSVHDAGSGIGLGLSRQIMPGHNGFIRVQSEPGQGSTFSLGFPKNRSK
jgi:signal transduction histidine kinase